MINKVKTIAQNPLDAAKEEEWEAQNEQLLLEGKKIKKRKIPFETQILEQTIVKIGALLALGFGEGGARIIRDYTNENSDINLNNPGQIKHGFFGFCDIRQFTVISECLQEKIINYVNVIADIVHGTAD